MSCATASKNALFCSLANTVLLCVSMYVVLGLCSCVVVCWYVVLCTDSYVVVCKYVVLCMYSCVIVMYVVD